MTDHARHEAAGRRHRLHRGSGRFRPRVLPRLRAGWHGLLAGWHGLRAAAAELVAVVLPVECAGCGAPDVAVCAGCAAELEGPARRVPGPVCADAALPAAGVPVWVVASYEGRIRRLIVSWKDRGRHDLTGLLAVSLGRSVLALLDDVAARPRSGGRATGSREPVLLVPVPSTRWARSRRGADLVLRLARTAAGGVRVRGAPVRVVPALRLGRRVADQAGLTRSGRALNVAGAMRLRAGAGPVVAGRPCVVVDDILTTGASAGEAARVLAAAGARPLGVAAVCATPLHRRLSDVAHLH